MNKIWWLAGLIVLVGAWLLFRPVSVLTKIQQFMPIQLQKDAVTVENWHAFEAETNVFVPEEFKAFIAVYGCGSVNRTLWVLAPMCLEYKGGTKNQERLLSDFYLTLISPPLQIQIRPPRDDASPSPSVETMRDLVDERWKRQKEFMVLLEQMQQTGQLKPTDMGLALLEKVRDFLVRYYQTKDASFAKQLNATDLSKIPRYTKDISQHERNEDYQEIYKDQLAEFFAQNKQLEGNQFYLWGSIRGTNYDLGWLGQKDQTGLHLQGNKIFLFSKDDFAILEMGFSEFVLRFLQHDQALWKQVGFTNDLDKAFANQDYSYIPNPYRR
jgi:hypothetical protein